MSPEFRVPIEIVDRILKRAYEFPQSNEDWRVLNACALVCKAWLPVAQSWLYQLFKNSRYHGRTTPGTLGPATLRYRPQLLAVTRSLTIHVIDEIPTSAHGWTPSIALIRLLVK
jgi:hypothetical protein